MAAPLRLAPHRQSAEPTGTAVAWNEVRIPAPLLLLRAFLSNHSGGFTGR
jgi:hypothetical protein